MINKVTKPSEIKPIEARAYTPSMHRRQVAERAQRQLEARPMLTVNKTHTHWLHVVNQGRENKASIKIIATGGQSSYDSSQIYTALARRIEYASDAQSAYDIARGFQVGGGIGYVRVTQHARNSVDYRWADVAPQIAAPARDVERAA